MAAKSTTTMSFSGPFFTKDPALTYGQNLDVMLRAMSVEAREDVRAQIESHRSEMPRWTGFSYGQVADRVHHPWREFQNYRLVWPSTFGLPGRPESKKSGSKASLTSGREQFFRGNAAAIIMAAASSIEGRWHPYRTTKNRLMRSRAVNMAELTKGLE